MCTLINYSMTMHTKYKFEFNLPKFRSYCLAIDNTFKYLTKVIDILKELSLILTAQPIFSTNEHPFCTAPNIKTYNKPSLLYIRNFVPGFGVGE